MAKRRIHMKADKTHLVSAHIVARHASNSSGINEDLEIVKRARESWKSATLEEISKRS